MPKKKFVAPVSTKTATHTKLALATLALAAAGGLAFVALPASPRVEEAQGSQRICGLQRLEAQEQCGTRRNIGYRSAVVTCADGTVQQLRSQSSCMSVGRWQVKAQGICKKACVTCRDSDHGQDNHVRGSVFIESTNPQHPREKIFVDTCQEENYPEEFYSINTVLEFSCERGDLRQDLLSCDDGSSCQRGTCVLPEQRIPDESPEETNPPLNSSLPKSASSTVTERVNESVNERVTDSIDQFRGYPVVTRIGTGNRQLTNGGNELMHFQVSAQRNDIGLYAFSFDITVEGIDSMYIILRDETDFANPVRLYEQNISFLNQFQVAEHQIVYALFDTDGDRFLGEERNVPAGGSRNFVLHGIVSGASSGDFISTFLLGDQQSHFGPRTAQEVYTLFPFHNFVWSDRSEQGHSINTLDWTNGYLVPGLPTETISVRL